jgi:hypothetical protein
MDEELTVAEVRKALSILRRTWEDNPQGRPMYLCDSLGVKNLSIQSFAFKFVTGHHVKRQKTLQRAKSTPIM